MRPVRSLLLTAVALAQVLVFACSGGGDDGGGDEPPFPVRGMLTEIVASDASELEGITLRADDGVEWTFAVLLDNTASVTAVHLEEHIRLEQPVLVYFRGSGDNRTAYQIDDAP